MTRLLPIALIACAACAPIGPPAPATEAGAQCDVSGVLDMIGQSATPEMVERLRERSGARTVRSYETGAILTMDFRPDRLNVEADKGGRIVKLNCG